MLMKPKALLIYYHEHKITFKDRTVPSDIAVLVETKTTHLAAKSLCTKSKLSKYFIPEATWVAT